MRPLRFALAALALSLPGVAAAPVPPIPPVAGCGCTPACGRAVVALHGRGCGPAGCVPGKPCRCEPNDCYVCRHPPRLPRSKALAGAVEMKSRRRVTAPQPLAGLVDVTQHGVMPGGVDVVGPLRALLASLTGPTRLYFPPGLYALSEPLIVSQPGVTFAGAGRLFSTIAGPGGIWFGRYETDFGVTLTPDHRPTCAGVLDATCNGKFGYATAGNAVYEFSHHALAWGGKSKADSRVHDDFGDTPAFTIQVAFTGQPTANQWCLIYTLGQPNVLVNQWLALAPGPTAATCDLVYLFKCQGDPDGPGTSYRRMDATVPANALVRARVWVDGPNKLAGISVGGVDVVTQPIPGPLQQTTGNVSAGIGCDSGGIPAGGVAPLTVYGLKLSNTAVRKEPADDATRYYSTADPACLITLAGDLNGYHTRLIRTAEGPALWGRTAWGWAYTTTGPGPMHGGLADCGVNDLNLRGGSPSVGVGDVLNFHMSGCTAAGDTNAVATVARLVSYPVTITDCQLSGSTDAAVSLRESIQVRLRNVDINGCGTYGGRFSGCDVDWQGGFFSFYTAATRAGVASLLGSGYGSSTTLANLYHDTEDHGGYVDACYYAEQQPYGATRVALDNCYSVNGTAGRPYLRLRGFGTAGVWQTGQVEARGCRVASVGYSAALQVDDDDPAGKSWAGVFDPSRMAVPGFAGASGNVTVK